METHDESEQARRKANWPPAIKRHMKAYWTRRQADMEAETEKELGRPSHCDALLDAFATEHARIVEPDVHQRRGGADHAEGRPVQEVVIPAGRDPRT